MRALPIVIGALATAAVIGAAMPKARTGPAQPPLRHFVLAELFTSEGCSSCPPADALLQRIAAESPVPGVQIVALEEHVDYWDNLGWRDPFSSAAFTRRQSDYGARVFRSDNIYTPQLVIDGAFAVIGSDDRGVRDAVGRAAARPAANVHVAATTADNRAHVEVSVDVPTAVGHGKDADIVVAIVEDGLTSRVERGENHGRTLSHAGVVRLLRAIGSLPSKSSSATAVGDFPVDRAWQASHLRAIVFVQERNTLRVLGSSVAALRAP